MTETKQEKRNLISPSFSQAILAGTVASGLATAFGTPLEYAPRIFLAGSCFSLYLSWSDSRTETKPKPKTKHGRSIPFTSAQGVKQIYRDDMEFSIKQDGFIYRENYLQVVTRKLFRKYLKQSAITNPIDQPKIINEFVFRVIYNNILIELREQHVRLFLKSAWRNRSGGKGLSVRHWERRRPQRPAWFRELPPYWFRGISVLIWNCQKSFNRQLVITLDNQQSFMVIEPHEMFGLLKWHEIERVNLMQGNRI